jgi:hypothetical protein
VTALEPLAPEPAAFDAAALPGAGTTSIRLGTAERVVAHQTLCPAGVHDYRRVRGVRTCRRCGTHAPTH